MYATTVWADAVARLEHDQRRRRRQRDYLQHPVVLENMNFADAAGANTEYFYLTRAWQEDELVRLLHVEPDGQPFPVAEYDPAVLTGKVTDQLPSWTTRTTVHHLYHLTKWMRITGHDLADISTVVEWGGGFGNLAKIAKRLNPNLHWTIIDLPAVSALQRRYLSDVGVTGVDCISVPFNEPPSAELFVSTWALCESTREAQLFVAAEHRWFGAQHFLIATQRDKDMFPDTEHFYDLVRYKGLEVPAIPADSTYILS